MKKSSKDVMLLDDNRRAIKQRESERCDVEGSTDDPRERP